MRPYTSCPPRPPLQCCTLNYLHSGLQKKQPFVFIVFGTSKHNIEVGGYGGNVCIYGVSCGWLFFLKNPGRVFFNPVFFNIHTHRYRAMSQHHLLIRIPIVDARACETCDNPIKVDAKGHHQPRPKICLQYVTTPKKVDAKGHQKHCPKIYVCNM